MTLLSLLGVAITAGSLGVGIGLLLCLDEWQDANRRARNRFWSLVIRWRAA